MQEKEIVYERIHSDFLIRLCEGEFPLGYWVPSIPDLCVQYNVGKNTIVKVLEMLKQNGFIETSPGKTGQVLFDCNALDQYVKDLPGFVCDKEILLDYYYAMEILFPSLYTCASLSCTEERLAEIGKIVAAFHSCEADGKACIRLSIRLSSTIIYAMDNRLARKITEITMRKTMLPALLLIGHNDLFRPLLLQAADATELLYATLMQRNAAQLKTCWKQLLSIYHAILEKALIFGIFPDTPSVRETDLFQVMDDEKRFLVAASLRNEILVGNYIPGDLLPSIAQAKALYRVSAITIRRAYQILGEMGFTQTINGRGTEVLHPSTSGKDSPFLKQAARNRKDRYLESVVFLEMICEDIVRAATHLSFSALRRDLDSPWNADRRYSVPMTMYHLFKGTASPAIFSIYKVISTYLYWGCHLKDIPAIEECANINHIKCIKLIDTLGRRDFVKATVLLRELLKTLHPPQSQCEEII